MHRQLIERPGKSDQRFLVVRLAILGAELRDLKSGAALGRLMPANQINQQAAGRCP
jgi:hypothetical protein